MWSTIFVGNDKTLLALGVLAERNHSIQLRKLRGILGLARLEQFRHTRQTAGDVTGFQRLLRNACEHVTHADLGAVFHGDDSARRQHVLGRNFRSRNIDRLALAIHQRDHRTDVLGPGAMFRIEHRVGGQTCDLVGLLVDRDAINEIAEGDLAPHFGDDRMRVRVPVGDHRTALHLGTVMHRQHGAERQLVTLAVAALVVLDDELTRTRHRDIVSARVFYHLEILEARDTRGFDLDARHRRGA